MASPPQSLDRNSLFAHRRPSSSLSENPYAPPTPSPLSPYSIPSTPSTSGTVTPIPITLPLNSHYYRPPRSSLTSPTRSNISSPTGSPTRTHRQTRIQSLLANDPLLSRLTPLTISRLSSDPEFAFSPAEKEWSLRAAEGIVKVGEWLREVEGWNLEWRRNGAGKGKESGMGYLPPSRDRPKKRRKLSVEGKGEMGSIKEEVEEETEESEGEVVNGKRPLRRKLFMDQSTDASDNEEEGENGAVKAPVEGMNGRHSKKPLTPYQLKLQRQKAEANGENIPVQESSISTPAKRTDRPIHEAYDGESTDEEEEGVEYWGSLKRTTIEHYLERVELIKSEIEELDVEALKSKVLAYRTGITNPLTDSSAIITAITLQLLPPLHRLTKLLSIWAVRLAVLRIVPVFLRWLQVAKDALDAGYAAINHPSISPNRLSSLDNTSWRGLEEETYTLMQETITQKVATAGKLMDTMLDALEGREDVLPDIWISELEDVEERVGAWEMDGERVVLEGRLRLEELRQRETRREEQERERAKTKLIMEQERSVEEARGAESVMESVMGHAEETERGLREAMEANEDVAGGIDLVGDEDVDGSGDEEGAEPGEINELLMRLEGVEKERLFSREASDSETEDKDEIVGPSSRWGMGTRWNSYVDILPGQHHVPMLRHGLSLGSITQPDLDTGSTTFHTPMATPFIPQEELVNKDRKVSSATEYYTPMPTPGIQSESPPSRPGSTTPTQFHTPMPTPLIPASQQEQPTLRRNSTPFHTPMPTPLMPAFQQGPPVLRRQPSMPFVPVPKLPPTAQVFTATARREPPSPETPKRAAEPEKEVKRTSPAILAAARYFFKAEKKEESKKDRAKREEEERKEEARKREEEEREMIAAVDAETERLAKLEEAEKVRAAKVKEVKERLAEAEKMREKERAVREIEEKKKVAEAERKRFVEEEERRKRKAEEEERIRQEEAERQKQAEAEEKRKATEAAALQAARVQAEEEKEVERLRKASIDRITALEAAEISTKAEHQRILAEEASIVAEDARQAMAEEQRIAAGKARSEAEAERLREVEAKGVAGRLATLEAARVQAEVEAEAEKRLAGEEAEAEAEQKRKAEAERITALEAEAERQRLATVEAARAKAEGDAHQAEADRLAVVDAARLKADAEAERLRLIEEQKRQVEAERAAAIETAQAEAAAERQRVAMEESEAKRQLEVQRIASLAAARLAAEEEQRKQAEIERLAVLEAARLKAEADRLRLIEEEVEQQRLAEIKRLASIEAARVKAEEEERVRLAEEEAKRQHQAEAERAAALEVARLKAEAEVERERIRMIEEEDARVKAEVEAAAEYRRLAEEEAEKHRKAELEQLAAIEAERQKSLEDARIAEIKRQQLVEQEAEKKRQVDIQHLAALEAARIKAEAEAVEEAKRLEEEVVRQRKAELERLATIEAARAVEQEAGRQQMIKLEDNRRRAIEEEARRNAEAHAEAIRHAEVEVARQRRAEFERLAVIESARAARMEFERERMAKLEIERLRAIEQEAENERRATLEIERLRLIEQEAEKQRLAALEAAHLEAEAEAKRQRIIEQERRVEDERLAAIAAAEEFERQKVAEEAKRRQEQGIAEAEAQEAENERLTALEAVRLAAEAEVEAERLRAIEDEEIRKLIAEREAKWLAQEEEEAERLRDIEEEEIRRQISEQEARWEAEEEEERRMIAQLQKEAMDADAKAERQQEKENEDIRRRIAAEEEKLDSEDEEELRMIAQIKKAALEADAEQSRQQAIEDEELQRIAAYDARYDEKEEGRIAGEIERECVRELQEEKRWEAEQHAEEKRVEEEIERERLRELREEQRWEAEEQAERERVSAAIAAIEAAEAEDERQKTIQEEEIQRRVAAQEEKWAADEEIEQQRFAETEAKAESDLTFEELDRRRRLAEDERQRLADLALMERERERLEAQEAERLRMERQIEETRLEAERLREQEQRRSQAQFSNHQGSNSEGDSISGDDITEDYQDLSSLIPSRPVKEADEGSEGEDMGKQPSVPPPSVSMTPVTSRSSSVLDEIKYKTPETTKGVSSGTWSLDSPGLGITPGESKSQGNDSEASSDMGEDLVAVENLAAHHSLQKALNDSVEYELPRNMLSPDRDMSDGSFNGMPAILVAPSTPQNGSDIDSGNTPQTTIWEHAVNSPVFDEDDSPQNSFGDESFPSDMNVDESGYPQLSVEDYDQEDEYSDFDMAPLATSTPKPKRRPGMLGGLDSITEVLTPRSPRDEYFRPSDDNAFGTPSKKSEKPGGLMLPGGLSSQDSPTSRRRSFNDYKVAPIGLNLGVGKQTTSSHNKLVVKRGTTPEPKAPIKAQRSQKFTRKAPLDMARPRSLSSTGNYISPGSTTKSVSKPAPPRSTLGPAIKAIRRPQMEIDSDDEESVISEQRWSRSKENTSDFHSSPPNLGTVARLNIQKRNTHKPPNINTQATPEKNRRLYQQKNSHDDESSVSSQAAPQTPRLEFPQASLDDKVNEILTSLPSPVRLTASNLQKLSETSKRQLPLRPFELTSPTGIPAPRSVGSSSIISDAPSSFRSGGRKHNPSIPGDIKLYHLHRDGGQAPIKLYIRLVGERGERVMVRVGGGWADLAEYLKEYATHHASKRRVVSGNGIEIQDLGGVHHHTLHPSRSISSLRSNSPAPGNSRSNSPSPGSRSRSVSAMGIRSRSNSALGNRPASSMGNRPNSSMGNRPGSSMGDRGRERSSSLVQSPSLTSPPAVMRGGHNGTGKERPNLTPFQPMNYQRPSGLSPPGGPVPLGGSRPPSRGQGASRPPSRGQGVNRPPSRPGSSHSAAGGIRRSASRLSFSESAFDVPDTASSSDVPPKPLGLAGPKGKKIAISPENQAWVEGMIGEVRKVSAHRRRRLTGGSNNGDIGLGDEVFVPGEIVEVQTGTGQQFGGRLEMSDMGKQGGTRRMFPKNG